MIEITIERCYSNFLSIGSKKSPYTFLFRLLLHKFSLSVFFFRTNYANDNSPCFITSLRKFFFLMKKLLLLSSLFISRISSAQNQNPYWQQEVNYHIRVKLDDVHHFLRG